MNQKPVVDTNNKIKWREKNLTITQKKITKSQRKTVREVSQELQNNQRTNDKRAINTFQCVCVCLVTQTCLTLCDPMDCSPPGSSVHGSLQARILKWVVISFSRISSQPADWTHVSSLSCTGRQILYCWVVCPLNTHTNTWGWNCWVPEVWAQPE